MYSGEGAWYFVTLPKEYTDELKMIISSGAKRGFGSQKVEATVGAFSWKTSIFPSNKDGAYLLPVKKEIRSKLDAHDGDILEVLVKLCDAWTVHQAVSGTSCIYFLDLVADNTAYEENNKKY